MKKIQPYDNKNEPHGYWQNYCNINKILYKCYYKNGRLIGYREYYNLDSTPNTKTFYLI